MTFRFEVEYAVDHAAMAAGKYRSTFVSVEAENATEASLRAAQMASRHGIATAVIPIDDQEGQ